MRVKFDGVGCIIVIVTVSAVFLTIKGVGEYEKVSKKERPLTPVEVSQLYSYSSAVTAMNSCYTYPAISLLCDANSHCYSSVKASAIGGSVKEY